MHEILNLVALTCGILYLAFLIAGIRRMRGASSYYDAEIALKHYLKAAGVELIAFGANLLDQEWWGVGFNVICLGILAFTVNETRKAADRLEGINR